MTQRDVARDNNRATSLYYNNDMPSLSAIADNTMVPQIELELEQFEKQNKERKFISGFLNRDDTRKFEADKRQYNNNNYKQKYNYGLGKTDSFDQIDAVYNDQTPYRSKNQDDVESFESSIKW